MEALDEMKKRRSRVLLRRLLFLLALVRFFSVYPVIRLLSPLPFFLLFHCRSRIFLRGYECLGPFCPPLVCNLFLLYPELSEH